MKKKPAVKHKKKSEVQELFEFIRNNVALKSDIAELRLELKTDIAGVMSEVKEIKQRLKDLEKATEEHSRYSKEIDYVLERIRVIEKHLGIKHTATA